MKPSSILKIVCVMTMVSVCFSNLQDDIHSKRETCRRRELRNDIEMFCQKWMEHDVCRVKRYTDHCTREIQCGFSPIWSNVRDYDERKCGMLCSLIRFSTIRPVSHFWKFNLVAPNFVTLERNYLNSTRRIIQNITEDHRDDRAYEDTIYQFFVALQYMKTAIITTKVPNCLAPREVEPEPGLYDGYRICTSEPMISSRYVDLRCTDKIRYDCYLDRMADSSYPLEHCGRHYKCQMGPGNTTTNLHRCAALCWLTRNAFLDFARGDLPSLEATKFDVIIDINGEKNYVFDVLYNVSRRIFYNSMFDAWDENEDGFNMSISVVSRLCYSEKPSTCRNNEFRAAYGSRFRIPEGAAMRPECTMTPSTNAQVQESCRVEVECDLRSYFAEKGWSRLNWCFFIEWMHFKSIEWMGVELRAATSLMVTNMNMTVEGGHKNRTWSLRRLLVMMFKDYDDFMELYGYSANVFRLSTYFERCREVMNRLTYEPPPLPLKCLASEPGRAAIRESMDRQEEILPDCGVERNPNGNNECERRAYCMTPSFDDWWQPWDLCLKMNWAMFNALYWHPHVKPHMVYARGNMTVDILDRDGETRVYDYINTTSNYFLIAIHHLVVTPDNRAAQPIAFYVKGVLENCQQYMG